VEAFVLAAGLGTRLRDLTRSVPKALIPVGGVPMLERVARRLIDAGVDRMIINVHSFPEQIVDFVERRASFGIEVHFSPEIERPLETGGGLLAAMPLFESDLPFFIHNTDVLSEISLADMYQHHQANSPLATLAVMNRASSRQLLFDSNGLLGRIDEGKGIRLESRVSRGTIEARAFAGIHVVSPSIFPLIDERGVFSILDPYLRLAGDGWQIDPYEVSGTSWIDIGKPEQLEEANRLLGTTATE
jgi:NDP-sugar pyrophosphorylase family protein